MINLKKTLIIYSIFCIIVILLISLVSVLNIKREYKKIDNYIGAVISNTFFNFQEFSSDIENYEIYIPNSSLYYYKENNIFKFTSSSENLNTALIEVGESAFLFGKDENNLQILGINNLTAGNYELDLNNINENLKKYTFGEVRNVQDNISKNPFYDQNDTKFILVLFLSNILVCLCIYLTIKFFEKSPKINILLNFSFILIFSVVIVVLILSTKMIPEVLFLGIPIIYISIYIIVFTILNRKKLIGKDVEQIFP